MIEKPPTVASDFLTTKRGQYKVVQSCYEFQKLIYRFVQVARDTSYLHNDASSRIELLIKEFNS